MSNNEKILIDINDTWFADISEMDKGKCEASEKDNRMVNTMRGVVRFIKAQITSVDLIDTNLNHYCAHF